MFYIMSCGYKEINSTFIHSISLGYAILTSIFYTKIFVIYLISVPFRNQFFYKLIADKLYTYVYTRVYNNLNRLLSLFFLSIIIIILLKQ